MQECSAAFIEAKIKTDGHFDGNGKTYFLSRPIEISAGEIKGVNAKLTDEAQAKADERAHAATEAYQAREAERDRLRALGVAFVWDLPEAP